MSVSSELMAKIERLESALEKAAGSRSSVPANVLFQENPYRQQATNDWPVERLKQVADAYGDAVVNDIHMRKANGGVRVSGIGPALVRLAAMSGNADARAIAMSQGMSGSYNDEQFEKEFGFTTLARAKSVGVPSWDRTTRKVLANERRKVALAEGSGITGGYIVPPQFMNELLTIEAEEGFFEQRAKVLPMNSRTAQWPMLDITTAQSSGTSPYFGGILAQWQPEAATISETEPAFKQSEWTAWDLVLYTVSSNQLLADNGIGLDALLTQLFGAAMTWYKEYAYLRGLGAGSSMPLGIINAPATIVQSRTTSNRFLLADAANMMAHAQIRSWDSACWVMHQSVLPQLIQMVGGGTIGSASTTNIPGNQLVWVTPLGDGSKGGAAMKLPTVFLHGLPIFFTEKVPQLGTKGDVMLMDCSKYVIGKRMDVQIDVSPHYLFRNNQLAWRVVCRGDGKPWLNSYITDASGWTVSPFVVLNT